MAVVRIDDRGDDGQRWPLRTRPSRRVNGSKRDTTADAGTNGTVLATVMYDAPLSVPVATLIEPP